MKSEVATQVTEEFIVSSVAPTICPVFGCEIGLLLGRALLFAVFDCPDRVPASVVERVRTEMERCAIPLSSNPVRRVLFVVVQEDDQCALHDITGNSTLDPTPNSYNQAVAGSMDAVLSLIASAKRQQQEQLGEFQTHLDGRLDRLEKDIHIIKTHVRQAASIPAFRLGSTQGHRSEDGRIAKLSNGPKTLEVLWREFVTGINGTKPASEYNHADIACNSTKYCRRKKFWDVVSLWLRAGKTAEQAIAKVYEVYHPVTSVTAILDKLAKDKKLGGHPQLRI